MAWKGVDIPIGNLPSVFFEYGMEKSVYLLDIFHRESLGIDQAAGSTIGAKSYPSMFATYGIEK